MMNMSRHLAAPCTCCAAVCSIVGEVLLESPTSTARAHRLQDVEGRVRMGGFLGAARAGEGGGGRAVCVGVYVCAGGGGVSSQRLRLTDSRHVLLLRRLVLGEHAHRSHVDQAGRALGRKSERAEHAPEQMAVDLVRVRFGAVMGALSCACACARAWEQDWVRGGGGEGAGRHTQPATITVVAGNAIAAKGV